MAARLLQGPEIDPSLEESSIGQFLFKNAEKFKDKICQVDGTLHKTETYGSVKLRSIRVAIAMQKQGITSKDIITICSSNTLDNTIPILAAIYLGAKVANIEGSLSMRHTKHLLSLVSPRFIFVEESAIGLIEKSLEGVKFQTEIVVFGHSSKYSCFSDWQNPQDCEDNFQPVEVDGNDDVLIYFTSGTTGLPKAVYHSHRSFFHITLQLWQSEFRGDIYHLGTFFWISAMVHLTVSFKLGTCRIFSRNASIEDIFKIIERYKVCTINFSPNLTDKFADFERAALYNTSSLEVVMCIGARMAVSQVKKMSNIFLGALLSNIYGMTEIGIISHLAIKISKEVVEEDFLSCGKPKPGIQVKIVDLNTEELLGANQNGEIRVKGPSLMKGYYNGNSSQALDIDGFLKTGDVGYYDANECIYVIDRIKEIISYQCWQISPSSLESVLLEHPAIKEAAVLGLPHITDGQIPAACVILKEGFTLSEKEIDAFLRERVTDRERLRGGVIFVNTLPRTPTGKISRRELKDFVTNIKNL